MVKFRKTRRKLRLRRRAPARKAVDRRQDASIMRLYKMVKYSKERKFVDQVPLTTNVSNSWTNILSRDLTYIPAGTNDNDRIGNKVKIYSHQIRLLITGGDATNVYRVMVIRFGKCIPAQVGVQHVLQNYNSATPYQLLSLKKRNTDVKYTILHDTGLSRLAYTNENETMRQKVININLTNKRGWYTQYEDANANSCNTGFTYCIMCTDSAAIPNVEVSSMARTVFSG